MDVVLAVVRDEGRLGGSGPGQRRQEKGRGDDRSSAHKQHLGVGITRGCRDLTVTGEALQSAC